MSFFYYVFLLLEFKSFTTTTTTTITFERTLSASYILLPYLMTLHNRDIVLSRDSSCALRSTIASVDY